MRGKSSTRDLRPIQRCVPRALTFDVGNTLIFPSPSLGEVYAEAAACNGIEITPAAAEQGFKNAWRQAQSEQEGLCYGTNHAEARRFWLKVVSRVFEPGGIAPSQAQAILDVLYERFAHAATWRVEPTWPQVLTACRTHGVKVGLVSNWDVRLRALLDELGIPSQVDAVVISAECGVEKPDPAIFHAALRLLGVDGQESLHTGDTFDDDCEAARAAGMQAVWFNPHGAPLPEGAVADSPQVRQLADLLPMLGLA